MKIIVIILLSLFLQAYPLTYPAFNGFQLNELNSITLTKFEFQTHPWHLTGLKTSQNSTLCGNTNVILGGLNIFNYNAVLSRTIPFLPSHTSIFFQLSFTLIDNLQTSDSFTLKIDNTSIPGGTNLGQYTPYFANNTCGNSSFPDATEFTIMGSLPHNTSNLTLAVTSLVSSAAGFGIREISVSFSNQTLSNLSSCYRINNTKIFNRAGECQCPQGFYFNGKRCTSCSANCLDCFGPSSNQCYSCAYGSSFNGTDCILCSSTCMTCTGTGKTQCVTCKYPYWKQRNGTCTSTCNLPVGYRQVVGTFQVCSTVCRDGEFLMFNGTCSSSCPSPLVQSVIDQNYFCNKPCPSGYFYYQNGSCLSSCPSPWVQSTQNGISLCNKPCQSGEFYYWNGTCLPSCPLVLVKYRVNQVDSCKKPCINNTDFYYPSTSSCLSVCSTPFVQSVWSGVNLCNPSCNSSSDFLYPNGSCYSSCVSPMKASSLGGWNVCLNPCSNANDYYYPSDQSCQSFCESPDIAQETQSIKICAQGSSLSSQEIQAVHTISSTVDKTGTVATGSVAASSIISSGNPKIIALISLLKMLEYIRYIDINYPPKLQLMLNLQDKGSISKLIEATQPESLKEQFIEYPLPGRFADYKELKSSFILNYWSALFVMAFAILVLGISMLFSRFAKEIAWAKCPFDKLRDSIKWNLLLIILFSNFDGVGVFSSLQLRNIRFDSLLAACEALTCIFVNLLVIFLLIKIPFITSSLQNAKCKVLPQTNNRFFKEKYQNCRVIFSTFRDASFLQQSCLFFILLRVYLFNLIIGYLFEYPLLQALLITFLSLLMLVYLATQKPYKSKLELFKMIVYESIILIINVCVLVLALLDKNDFGASALRTDLGDTIILTNLLFSTFAVTFLVIEIILKCISTFKFARNLQKRGLRYWLAVLKFLIQPEELEMAGGLQQKKSFEQKIQLSIKTISPLDLHQTPQETPNHRTSKSPLLPDLFHSPSPLSNSIILGNSLGDLIATPRILRASLRGRNSQLHNLTKNTSQSSFEGNAKKISLIVDHLKSFNQSGCATRSSFSSASNYGADVERKNKSLLAALERSKLFLQSQNGESSNPEIETKNLIDSRKGSSEMSLFQ